MPIEALAILREQLPAAARTLGLETAGPLADWCDALDRRLLSRLALEAPLVCAICGGGSSGKSTLFNALAGKTLSPVGGRAGINRRTLVGLHPDRMETIAAILPALCPGERALDRLAAPSDLTVGGAPLTAAAPGLPRNLVLLDTPDFDTGGSGVYTNREAARAALAAADLLIYIFTNSNYSNRDNTEFVARVLTGIGRRPCLLVYRAYPGFSVEEVQAHARVVAGNLYGEAADQWVLGVYRADEDNAVAAGRRPMTFAPVPSGEPPLEERLARLDPRPLRLRALGSLLADLLGQAEALAAELAAERRTLERYALLLQARETRAAQEALGRFPADAVMRRFAALWLAADPPYLRAMRAAGRVLDLPVRLLVAALRREATPPLPPAAAPAGEVADALVDAASRLRLAMAGEELSLALHPADPLARRLAEIGPDSAGCGAAPGDPCRVPAPPALRMQRAQLAAAAWQQMLPEIRRQGAEVLDSGGIDAELRQLAERFRAGMGWGGRLRQTFAAALNILPATAAVTWVVSTGDPLGAVGLKVKLTGLLGLHDLYALVALPATSGLKQADRLQLEQLLAPVAQAWLARKLDALRGLLRRTLTGSLLETAQGCLERSAVALERAASALQAAREALP